MRTLIEATELRIRHLEKIRSACDATIAAERHLLHLQRASPLNSGTVTMPARNGHKNGGPARHTNGTPALSSRKRIVKLLEAHYPQDFDPQAVSRKTGVVKRSPDGRLSTYSLLARLYHEGKIDKQATGLYRALAPSKRAKSA